VLKDVSFILIETTLIIREVPILSLITDEFHVVVNHLLQHLQQVVV